MYKDKTVCIVVPAHNEESQIERVIRTMPDYVDEMIIIDDASTDSTVEHIKPFLGEQSKVTLIQHRTNRGVGGAISSGYQEAAKKKFDVIAVMAGDGQMHPDDLEMIILPVVTAEADYAKGNRLFYGDAWKMIPRHRYLGNSFLSLLTKIASGYWHIADSQSGFTAISLRALERIDLKKIYSDFGMPNDLLIKLNMHDFKVKDVHVKPRYNVGEQSEIKFGRLIPRILWLLFKGFWQRLFFKYVIKDFHPLVFFYLFGFIFGIVTVALFGRVFYYWFFTGRIPPINALAAMFSFMSTSLFTLFAMWFDMENNKDLK
jgi:glycosyltransferase involved in cell wall biosynthesis